MTNFPSLLPLPSSLPPRLAMLPVSYLSFQRYFIHTSQHRIRHYSFISVTQEAARVYTVLIQVTSAGSGLGQGTEQMYSGFFSQRPWRH